MRNWLPTLLDARGYFSGTLNFGATFGIAIVNGNETNA
jgi:hypothetical protein